jgi:ankyrin repeat protein
MGADPNEIAYSCEGGGWTITPLINALAECANGCVGALLEAGANPNAVCEDFSCKTFPTERCTPLLLAEVTCNDKARRMLLAHGADPDLAVRLGLSEATFRPINNVRARFFCPVHRTLKLIEGRRELRKIRKALKRVSDLDAGKGTLLTAACRDRRVDVIQHLLELGADPKKIWGDYVIEADTGDGALLRRFLAHGFPATANGCFVPLIGACRRGQATLVTLLLEHGAEPDFSYPESSEWFAYERTALMESLLNWSLECIGALLKGGAHPDLVAPGFNRLDEYDRAKENPVLQDLGWGFDIRRFQNSCTPLMVACAMGFEEAVKLLLDHGASKSLADRDGKTARDYTVLVKDEALRQRIVLMLDWRKNTAFAEPLF